MLAQDGKWEGKQVLPAGWVQTMATPSVRNVNFGLGLWLGSPYDAKRERLWAPQSEPFLADDVRFMQGGGYRYRLHRTVQATRNIPPRQGSCRLGQRCVGQYDTAALPLVPAGRRLRATGQGFLGGFGF
ncbi:MAG: hypothetical protein IPG25_19130 [Proteobacteria bacterium]|nr:hypothetical protein [Pseudomonadota bacterium]